MSTVAPGAAAPRARGSACSTLTRCSGVGASASATRSVQFWKRATECDAAVPLVGAKSVQRGRRASRMSSQASRLHSTFSTSILAEERGV
eukprot:4775116-Prymnesium_polylepis.1